jgi:hypothetical protein
MTYLMQGFGAVSAGDAASKIVAFAKAAKDEAERCFAATTLHMDVDRQRADDVITTAAQAATTAKASDPAKAKAAIDTAMTKIAGILPQIKSTADVSKVQTAATAAKSAINAAVAQAKAPAPVVPPPSESGGFSMPSIPPVAIIAVAVAAALFLLPGKKRSNPSNLVKTRSDEKLWRRAKEAAKRQGRSDYPYIVGTFKHMQANKALSRL